MHLLAKHAVRASDQQTVTVTGLAAGERVTVTYQASRRRVAEGLPARVIAAAGLSAEAGHMKMFHRLVCAVRSHAWDPVEGDVNGAHRTCRRCGRNQPVDLQPRVARWSEPGDAH